MIAINMVLSELTATMECAGQEYASDGLFCKRKDWHYFYELYAKRVVSGETDGEGNDPQDTSEFEDEDMNIARELNQKYHENPRYEMCKWL